MTVLSTSYPRFRGDFAGSFVKEHVDWMKEVGHDVRVLAAGGPESLADVSVAGTQLVYEKGGPEFFSEVMDGNPIERLGKGVLAAKKTVQFTARYSKEASRLLEGADAVVAHWLLPCGWVACSKRTVPVLVVVHSGDVWLANRFHLANRLIERFRRGDVRLSFVSERVRKRLLENLSKRNASFVLSRSIVCPMGVHTAPMSWAANRDRHVLFVGRLETIKGVELAIQAVSRLENIRMTIAGEGSQRKRLEDMAKTFGVPCKFTGAVTAAQRDFLMANASLLLVPSLTLNGREEGFPRVILEGLATGIPVLTTAPLPGEVPVLRTNPSVSELCEEMNRFFESPELAYNISNRGKRWVRQFSWNKVGLRLHGHLFKEFQPV